MAGYRSRKFEFGELGKPGKATLGRGELRDEQEDPRLVVVDLALFGLPPLCPHPGGGRFEVGAGGHDASSSASKGSEK
ncbi:hypothetical protein ACE1SV_59710 [Streptomyces sennicomposti]